MRFHPYIHGYTTLKYLFLEIFTLLQISRVFFFFFFSFVANYSCCLISTNTRKMQCRRGLCTSWSALDLFVSVIECSLDVVQMRMMTIGEIKNGGEIHIDTTIYHNPHLTIRERSRKLSTRPKLPSTHYVSSNHNHSVVVFKISINLYSNPSCCTKEEKMLYCETYMCRTSKCSRYILNILFHFNFHVHFHETSRNTNPFLFLVILSIPYSVHIKSEHIKPNQTNPPLQTQIAIQPRSVITPPQNLISHSPPLFPNNPSHSYIASPFTYLPKPPNSPSSISPINLSHYTYYK